MERNAFLINKKIHQYILPGVLMTVAMQLGNVVDGMIVGNLLGPEAMAAIEISMPALLLLQMPAMMLAMGALPGRRCFWENAVQRKRAAYSARPF